MGTATRKLREHIHHHRDGSIWARGQMTADGIMAGYWEWFRKDGTKMRSGYFENGEQAGVWTTYDRNGTVVKVTQFKAKQVAQSTTKKTGKKKPAQRKAAKSASVKKKAASKQTKS